LKSAHIERELVLLLKTPVKTALSKNQHLLCTLDYQKAVEAYARFHLSSITAVDFSVMTNQSRLGNGSNEFIWATE
jgi:hypothetical protein